MTGDVHGGLFESNRQAHNAEDVQIGSGHIFEVVIMFRLMRVSLGSSAVMAFALRCW